MSAAALPVTREDLIAAVASGRRFDYVFFWGHRPSPDGAVSRSCFSQWYAATFRVNDEVFRTAEHYMMLRKARLFGDEPTARQILAAPTPNDAKSLGRKVRGFSEETWNAQREEIVVTGNLAKFSQHLPLRRFLLETADAVLVEASPLDAIWGIGLAHDHPQAPDPANWPGLNLLGFALMRVREQLRAH